METCDNVVYHCQMSTNVCVTTEGVTLTLPASMYLAASGVSVTRALKVMATGAKVCHKDSVICHKDVSYVTKTVSDSAATFDLFHLCIVFII